jgi:hypothetical protein
LLELIYAGCFFVVARELLIEVAATSWSRSSRGLGCP